MKRYKWFAKIATGMLLAITMLGMNSCDNKNGKTSFAIVIDSDTYEHTREAVDAYRNLLETEGLHTHLLEDNWDNPVDIREQLYDLHTNGNPPLEGAVFIGDIPIPMIRDAQHLTSAFKMDQERFPYARSSVPSDRFYDDFDLEFTFLEQDEEQPLYYYYSLDPTSKQKVSIDIYSGRIRPPKNGEDSYEQISNYLEKVVAERKEENALEHVTTYSGHGYNSECLVAWAGERMAYQEQLPKLTSHGNSYTYLFTYMQEFSKNQLLSEIQRPELDLIVMSNHGSPTAQYLDGWPNVSSIGPSIENVKRFLRNRLRGAHQGGNDPEATIQSFMERHGVPRAWFDGALDPETTRQDSIFNASLDIYLPDLKGITPNARVMKFDACFNGSFHQDEYIAGSYVFGEGKTIAGIGNSVNVIQDNWPIQLIGLLDKGVRIGNWIKHQNELENHIIGDPTHFFNTQGSTDWNSEITLSKNHTSTWKDALNHEDPDIQSLALIMLHNNEYDGISDLLLETYKTSPYNSVRMQCLDLLYEYDNEQFHQVLEMAVSDPYELIRRHSVKMIGETGRDELVPALVSVQFEDPASKRVLFNARNAASFMNKEVLQREIEKQFEDSYLVHKDDLKDMILRLANGRIVSDLDIIRDKDAETNSRLFELRSLRNYNYHFNVPAYVEFALNSREEKELRLHMIEALGWFTHSYNKNLILEMCRRIKDNELEDEAIREEALKTLNRIQAYSS
ncbi:MAG: HEAT repeat domain-containing protein [Bacteroidales bacterium]